MSDIHRSWQVWLGGRSCTLELDEAGLRVGSSDSDPVEVLWPQITALDFPTAYSIRLRTAGAAYSLGFVDRDECARFAAALPAELASRVSRRPADPRARREVARRASEPVDPGSVLLRGATILGGYGHPFDAGDVVRLSIDTTDAVISIVRGPHRLDVGLDHLHALRVTGPGAVTTGGGFAGGGFGVEGAIEGMAIAAVLNSLTTRTSISTLLWVTAHSAEVVIHLNSITPQNLEIVLSPIQGRLQVRERQGRERPASAVAAGPEDLVGALARLAELHRAGALDDDEFARSKAKLLA